MLVMVLLAACGSNTPDTTSSTTSDSSTEATPEITPEATASLTLVAPEPTPVQSGVTPAEDVIAANVEAADALRGSELYNQALVPTCVTCHQVDSSQRQVGPSLVNFSEVAGTRVEGQGPFTYAYNSIRYANMHIVEGYQANLMPVYDGILTDQEVYDLIAYMWNLEDTE